MAKVLRVKASLVDVLCEGVKERVAFVTSWDPQTQREEGKKIATALAEDKQFSRLAAEGNALKVIQAIKLAVDRHVSEHGGPDGLDRT